MVRCEGCLTWIRHFIVESCGALAAWRWETHEFPHLYTESDVRPPKTWCKINTYNICWRVRTGYVWRYAHIQHTQTTMRWWACAWARVCVQLNAHNISIYSNGFMRGWYGSLLIMYASVGTASARVHSPQPQQYKYTQVYTNIRVY